MRGTQRERECMGGASRESRGSGLSWVRGLALVPSVMIISLLPLK